MLLDDNKNSETNQKLMVELWAKNFGETTGICLEPAFGQSR